MIVLKEPTNILTDQDRRYLFRCRECKAEFLAKNMGLLFLTGCNVQMVDLNYKYEKAYIELPTGYEEVEIKSWTDYEDSDMVQITTTDGTVYYTHGSKVVLVHGD